MCMDRISQVRRGACIKMNLPPIRTAEDTDQAAAKVTQAVWRGELTPTDGGIAMHLLESRSRIMDRVQREGERQDERVVTTTTDQALATLTDDELAQLIAITAKLESAGSGADRTERPP